MTRLAPIYAWESDGGPDRLGVIEEDIRRLLRELATANSALAREEGDHSRDIEKLLLSMIEVVDAFDRVFENVQQKSDQLTPQTELWITNFRTVCRLIEKLLTEQGVTRIEGLGKEFDPEWHRAAATVADTSSSDGTIVRELQRGYAWRNRALRKTEAVVIQNDKARGADNER